MGELLKRNGPYRALHLKSEEVDVEEAKVLKLRHSCAWGKLDHLHYTTGDNGHAKCLQVGLVQFFIPGLPLLALFPFLRLEVASMELENGEFIPENCDELGP